MANNTDPQTVFFLPLLKVCLLLRTLGEVSSPELFALSLLDRTRFDDTIRLLTSMNFVEAHGENFRYTGPGLTS